MTEDIAAVADRYRRLAAATTARIAAVPDDGWSRRTPCEDWTTRALVGHLIDVHGRFESMMGRDLAAHASVDGFVCLDLLENGVISQPLEPAPDASEQDRLLCALGRRP